MEIARDEKKIAHTVGLAPDVSACPRALDSVATVVSLRIGWLTPIPV
jgi:hypothetical protein